MTKKRYTTGAFLSPSDSRDFSLSVIATVSTHKEKEYDQEWIPEARNQGKVGACVAFSIDYLREAQEYVELGKKVRLSEGYVYTNRHITDHQSEGMLVRQALARMLDYGVCYKDIYPELVKYYKAKGKLTEEMHENAKPRKIAAYARVRSLNEKMSAIKELQGFVAVFKVHKNFFTVGKDGIINKPKEHEIDDDAGFHAMYVYGWIFINGKLYWKVLNSWGTDWGNNGKCLIADDYKMWEAWSITDARTHGKPEKWIRIGLRDGEMHNLFEHKYESMELPVVVLNRNTDPHIDGERAYMPLRYILEELGHAVLYKKETNEIFISIQQKNNPEKEER